MRLLSLFFLLMFCLSYADGAGNYAFTPIDANSGLSGNKVRNITQLPDGRMVITTEGLVNIYDGTTFSYLHYSDKNSLFLSGYSGFHHEYVAHNGYMWLKNKQRLFLIDINKERFSDNPKSLLASWGITEALSDFFMDKEKSLWLITGKDDLYYLPEGKKKKQLFLKKVSQIAGSNDCVYDLAVLDKKVYLFFRSGILICFDLRSQKELYRQMSLEQNRGAKYASTSFVMPGKKQFFQLKNGSGGGIMLAYDTGKRQWNTILQTPYWLNYLSIDSAGDVWLTCKEGIWHLNANLTKKEFIPRLKLVDGQVINTEVSTISHDRQGGMWLGTLNRGLLYYHPDRFKFKNIGKTLFPVNNEATINVSCFSQLGNGNIAIGTLQGLFQYNENNGKVTPYPSGRNLSCNALWKDRRNQIWIATNGQGLFRIDARGTLRSYPSSPKTIYSITENADSGLLLSTNNSGFGVFYPEIGNYRQIATSKTMAYGPVFQISYLNKEVLVGICGEGFFVYNIKSKAIKLHRDSRGYTAMLVDKNKHVWLGSQDGLHLWDRRSGRRRSFYTEHGLINNYIQSITQSPNGAIWISTSSGLTRLTDRRERNGRNGYSFANFNRVDGIIANEFWERAVYASTSGNIFWGGTDGFNILPAQRVVTNKQTPVPLFVNFMLFNKKVESDVAYDNNVILKKSLPLTKEIVLNYDQNFFSLEFSALNYVNPTQTYYRYQLLGVDQKEQELQSANGRAQFNYTDVKPGTYRLKVRAADNAIDWTDKYATINIVVKAPFWKTGIAYCFYIITVSVVLVLGTWFYFKKKRKKLVQEQKEKLNEMKSAFLQNVNNELNEPLTQIITPLASILKHTDEGRLKVQLKEIQNNALDLKELVDQLSEGVLSPPTMNEKELNMEVLLLNMRKLLELQQERKEQNGDKNVPSTTDSLLTAYDENLIQRALKYVEDNLDNPNYSVELLSKDMGMDRTGLYRKLLNVIGKTPTTFIRSVRLKRAALLLKEGLTVAEVADRVGFSTASYLSKCFQEEFGMKPSQYVISFKQKKIN